MKNIQYFNAFAVGLPLFILITYPIFEDGALFYSLLSTMITGFIQVILGLCMLNDEPNDRKLQFYIGAVVTFFTLWFINAQIGYNNILTFTLFGIPPLLTFYLTFIIYKKAKS
ncbi:hypothetical protein WMW71_08525 [Flavobacterium buctense]|uniref:Uncharacterized protein n=1 Tax=Flavobacterium buctense TaxID=1648146 RepID=A0ABU9E145_9FLAO|nr:hypothetical protein [Flavobacterium buctense]